MESQLGKKESGASEFPFSFLKKMGGPYLPLRLPVTHTADLRDPNGTFLQQLNITGRANRNGVSRFCSPGLPGSCGSCPMATLDLNLNRTGSQVRVCKV